MKNVKKYFYSKRATPIPGMDFKPGTVNYEFLNTNDLELLLELIDDLSKKVESMEKTINLIGNRTGAKLNWKARR